MAIIVAAKQRLAALSGGVVIDAVTITLDTSYPTGGSGGLANLCGHSKTYGLLTTVGTGFDVDYLPATDKLQLFNSGGGGAGTKATEVGNATNLSATQIQGIAIGQLA